MLKSYYWKQSQRKWYLSKSHAKKESIYISYWYSKHTCFDDGFRCFVKLFPTKLSIFFIYELFLLVYLYRYIYCVKKLFSDTNKTLYIYIQLYKFFMLFTILLSPTPHIRWSYWFILHRILKRLFLLWKMASREVHGKESR